ncbi:unnamed protein product [Blepharisma stoltei]|uniref:GPI transamidase subunit PIG-U n=1 Tax=Blepharisma stoltei TaxID=1481888 RepID=A0AAU9JR99_9CILI|nr:unnamed protein product [Blepharisma stoltei]
MLYKIASIGILLRIIMYHWFPIQPIPHISSPYTDYKNALEGLSYLSLGLSPYYSDSPVHTPPLILWLFSLMPSQHIIFGLILSADLLNSIYIYLITKSKLAFSIYLVNPISIISTSSMSLSSFIHLAILTFGYFTLERRRLRAVFAISFLSYLDPCMLSISSLWYFNHFTKRIYILAFLMTFSLFSASYALFGETWDWLWSCQIAQLLNYDIKPNIGMAWYLILEMFKRYQFLYRVILAIHPWLYIYPLHCLLHKYSKYSMYKNTSNLYFCILYLICVVSHPHPTMEDFMIPFILISTHGELIMRVKSGFFTVTAGVIGVILSIAMWGMWTERVGGNANFLFFQTIFTNLMIFGFLFGLLHQVNEEIKMKKHQITCKTIVEEVVLSILK